MTARTYRSTDGDRVLVRLLSDLAMVQAGEFIKGGRGLTQTEGSEKQVGAVWPVDQKNPWGREKEAGTMVV